MSANRQTRLGRQTTRAAAMWWSTKKSTTKQAKAKVKITEIKIGKQ